MKDYKDKLWMYQTPFEMRGNLGVKEPLIQLKWQNIDLYNKRIAQNEGLEPFVLHDGPPFANGAIHVGHAMNKSLKDFIVRYYNMNKRIARYIPGWDTHGLPIETALSNKGIRRKEMSIPEFRKLCEEYAIKQVEMQKQGFTRLGSLGEYDNLYMTLDKQYEADEVRVFAKMVKNNMIYKGLKPVYWSPSSESALAEAEIEYIDREDNSIFVAMPIIDGADILANAHLVIWTTTPWTIPANLAVCAGEKIEYVLVLANAKKYIVAKELLEQLKGELAWDNVEIIKIYKGSELEGLKYKHPLYDRISPVILGDHVTTVDGTGLVHTAPGHGEDDYIVGKKYNLDIICPVDGKGFMTDESYQYANLFYQDCNAKIIEDLENLGYLLAKRKLMHSYPHDWRTKKPIIFRATPQWFASIDSIKELLLSEVENIKWFPKWGEVRMANMIKDRHDWCISRQRAWGLPIPILYTEDGKPILDEDVFEHIAKIFEEHGSGSWYTLSETELLPQGYKNEASPNHIFKKETDTLDVWFDSGTSYQLLAHHYISFPADLYLEGADQYRGWFNASLITSVATRGITPFKNNVTHGFVLDGEGRKMSKSLGNVIDPNDIFKNLGADIFRLWVTSVEYNVDVRISDDMLKQIAESYRKIRNTFRFLLANLADFTPSSDLIPYENLEEVDKYLLIKLNNLLDVIHQGYQKYEFSEIYRNLMPFITNDLSAFYLDFTKDILYIEQKDGLRRRSVQTVLYTILDSLAKVLTPIIPHTTSEIYDLFNEREKEDIYLTNMPDAIKFEGSDIILEKWEGFMEYRSLILKALEDARNEKIIGKSFNAHLILQLDSKAQSLFNKLEGNLRQILIVSKLIVKAGREFRVVVEAAEGCTCSRCWQIVDKINEDELCERCAKVVGDILA